MNLDLIKPGSIYVISDGRISFPGVLPYYQFLLIKSRIALHRLVANDKIKRVAQGIYVRPKHSDLIGEVLPTTDEIARAIAKRDRTRIIPTGSYALNVLGISTQVPMNFVYLTDGAPRKIQLKVGNIKFKKTTPGSTHLNHEDFH